MIKNLIIALLIITVSVLTYMFLNNKKNNSRKIIKSENVIDSIEVANALLNSDVELFKDSVQRITLTQEWYERKADSLALQLKLRKMKCPEKVFVLKKEVVAIRSALKKCNEAKVVQVKTIHKLDTLLVNNKIICNENKKIDTLKNRKWQHRAEGGIVIVILVILGFILF